MSKEQNTKTQEAGRVTRHGHGPGMGGEKS